MTTTTEVNVRFYVDIDAKDQLEDVGISSALIGDCLEFIHPVDETLLESLSPDELIEFVGIDSEFLVGLHIEL